jgi:hypothetical protein
MADAISNLEEQIRVRKEEKVKTLNLIKGLKGQKDKEYLAVLNMRKHNRINTNIEDMEGRLRNLKNLKENLDKLSRQKARPNTLPPLKPKTIKSTSKTSASSKISQQPLDDIPSGLHIKIVAQRRNSRVSPEAARSPARSPIPTLIPIQERVSPNSPKKQGVLGRIKNYLVIKGDKFEKKISYIHYFDLRFQYLLKFLKNISAIFTLYTGNTLNKEVLILINAKISEVERSRLKWGNIKLEEGALDTLPNVKSWKDKGDLNSITLSHIIKKIREQNAIIEEFLNAISRILGEDDKLAFIKWINSQFYKDAQKRMNNFILSHKKTERELERSMREEEVDYQLFSAYNIKPKYTNEYPLYSFNPIKEYSDKIKEYIASDYTFRREHSGGGIFWRSTKKVAPEEQRGVPEIKDYEKEEMEVANINLYRTPNIILFFNIMNYVLKYIEVVALYLNTRRGGDIGSYEDDLIKINVSLKIMDAIKDSEMYKNELIAYDNKNNLFSDVGNSTQIHQSIYLHYYKLSGGRKQRRTVGRPRKTPVKKLVAKPVKKPVAKPVKPATKKPSATKPAIKPTKPTKK